MTGRIFRSICLAAMGVFIVLLTVIMSVLYGYFSSSQAGSLRDETEIAARGTELSGKDYLETLEAKKYRVSWIAADGSVIFDSAKDSSSMENHLEREEIKEALETGFGECARFSDTIMERQLYCAMRLSDGSVLRLSVKQLTWWSIILVMLQPIAVSAVICAALSLLLAYRLSHVIVKPLNNIDADSADKAVYPELAPVVSRLRGLKKQLEEQEERLVRQRREFETATGGMSEGIVLLSEDCGLLSANPAARRILSLGGELVGKIPELDETIAAARDGGVHREMIKEISGREYHFLVSPVMSDGHVCGTAIIIMDITERETAEKMRREFTANVSHELKTPLQSISGYAELLSSGMVREEDRGEFYSRIYSEARRMITLVGDIIRLSRLDEGAGDMKREDADLSAIASAAVEELRDVAKSAGITIEYDGESAMLKNAIPGLLSLTVYNLCDTAIKYNKDGVKVTVEVKKTDGGVRLTVSDTGIGIPEDSLERVFERFYRVDKSRSKEVGGTGLGLSIVKHAALLHNAKPEIHSTVGQGTTISILYPEDCSKVE